MFILNGFNSNFKEKYITIGRKILYILVARNIVLKKLWCFTEQLLNLAEQNKVL